MHKEQLFDKKSVFGLGIWMHLSLESNELHVGRSRTQATKLALPGLVYHRAYRRPNEDGLEDISTSGWELRIDRYLHLWFQNLDSVSVVRYGIQPKGPNRIEYFTRFFDYDLTSCGGKVARQAIEFLENNFIYDDRKKEQEQRRQ